MIRSLHFVSLGAASLFLVLLAGPASAQCSSGGGSCAGGSCGGGSYDGGSCGGGGSCGSEGCGSCKGGPCPPPYKYHFEGPPCIIFKHACPRPVCDPCHLEHFGYYATCWRPWPFPPDWSHCPTPPPGAVLPPPAVPPFSPRVPATTAQPRTEESDRDRSRDRTPEGGSDAPTFPRPRKMEPDREPTPKLDGKPSVRFIE